MDRTIRPAAQRRAGHRTSCGSLSLSIPDHSKPRNGKREGIEAIEGIWEKVANESAQKEIPGDGFDGCDAFAEGGWPT